MTKDMSPWSIKLDIREPGEIKELSYGICKYEYEVDTLLSGDFALFYEDKPVVGVERKGAKDFVDSIRDGRIFKQVDLMKDVYEVNFIAISGSIGDELYDTDIPMSVIMGTIASLVTRRGVNILWFDYDDHLVDCIFLIFEKIMDGKYDDIEVGRKKADFISFPYYSLIKIPFVHNSMANELLTRFDSLEEIADAEKDELLKVKGIGEKRYKELKEVLKNVIG